MSFEFITRMGSIPDSDQFALALGDEVVVVPWGGRSPRGLTRAALSLFSRQEPPKSVSEFVDPEQGDLFKKAVSRTRGAAPLLPLKEK